jgi:hypothetical protein
MLVQVRLVERTKLAVAADMQGPELDLLLVLAVLRPCFLDCGHCGCVAGGTLKICNPFSLQ